jgi:hypothetical protein
MLIDVIQYRGSSFPEVKTITAEKMLLLAISFEALPHFFSVSFEFSLKRKEKNPMNSIQHGRETC